MAFRKKRRKRRNRENEFSLGVLRLEPRRVLTVNAALAGFGGDVLQVDITDVNEVASIEIASSGLEVKDSGGAVVGTFQVGDIKELRVLGDTSAGQQLAISGDPLSLDRSFAVSDIVKFQLSTQLSAGAASQVDIAGLFEITAGSSVDVSANNQDLSLGFRELTVDSTATVATGTGDLELSVNGVASVGVGDRTEGVGRIGESFLQQSVNVQGMVSITGDDPNLVVRVRDVQLASATYDVTVDAGSVVVGGDATDDSTIHDDRDASFQANGFTSSAGGWSGTVHTSLANQDNTAKWDISGVENGQYVLAATWTADTQHATNTLFVVDNGTALSTFQVDQTVLPTEFSLSAVAWQNLGVVSVTNGALEVSVSDAGRDGAVVADAIRLSRIDAGIVRDDALPGFLHTGFTTSVAGVFGGAVAASPDAGVATWTFTGLADGVYSANTSWVGNALATSSVTYEVTTGGQTRTATFDQRVGPAAFRDGGVDWAQLGFYQVSGGELTVKVDASGADGLVLADVVRLELATPDLAVGNNATVTLSASGSVTRDATNNRSGVVDAQRVVFEAGGVVGGAAAPMVVRASELESMAAGDVHLVALTATTVTDSRFAGVTSQKGNVRIDSAAELNVAGLVRGQQVLVQAGELDVSGGITATNGSLLINARGDIALVGLGNVTQNGVGQLTLAAAGTASGAIAAADGTAVIAAGDANLTATGDIQIANVQSGGTVRVQTGGAVTDGGDSTNDVRATRLALISTSGVGVANGLETQLSELSFVNTSTNIVDIRNTGALSVVAPETTTQNQTGGAASVTAASPLIVSSDITVGGDLTLTAGGSLVDATDDVTIQAIVTLAATSAATVRLNAGDDIVFDGGKIVTSPATHTVELFANTESNLGDGGGGTIVQNGSQEAVTATNLVLNTTQSVGGGSPLITDIQNLQMNVGSVHLQNAGDLALTGTVTTDLVITTVDGSITDSGTTSVGNSSRFEMKSADETILLDQLNAAGPIALFTQGASGDATVVNSTQVDLATSNVGGNLNVTANVGGIVDSGTVTVAGTGGFRSQQANEDVVLDQLNVSGAISLLTTGPNGDATIINTTQVDLAASDVGGNLDVTATTDGIVDSGTTTVAGTSDFTSLESGADVLLDQLNVSGSISVLTTGPDGDATLVNAVGIDFSDSVIDGRLTAAATTGGITDSGMTLVSGDASFTTLQNGQSIGLNQLGVDGSISLHTGTDGDATIVNKTAIDLAASAIDGALSVTATTGSITDSGTITVAKDARFETLIADDSISLDQLIVTGTIGLFTQGSNGDASIVNTAQVDMSASDVGGNLNVTATTGGIVDSGTVTVAGTSEFTSQESGADIVLDQLNVSGSISVLTIGPSGDATLVNAVGIDLANSVVDGKLTSTATTGGITDSGMTLVSGDAGFTTLQNGQSIVLNQLGVGGSISLQTATDGVATIVNKTAIDLAASIVGGNLSATATTGSITDSGTITVAKNTRFETVVADETITLDRLSVTGTIGLFTHGGNGDATIVNSTQVDLAASDVGSNLDVTATTGGIVDSGTVTVAGDARFDSVESGADILLDQLDVTGTITFTTVGPCGDVTLVNTTAIDLAASVIDGALSVTATTGSITDSGTITVAKDARFETLTADDTISLDQLNVSGTIGLFTQGSNGNASIVNTTQVDMSASDVGGNLNVTATTGGFGDSGTVTVAGTSDFTSHESAADVLLDQLNVSGSISVLTTGPNGDATLVNAVGIDFASSTVDGKLTVTATTGGITDSGMTLVSGGAGFTTLQNGQSIVLNQLGVDGSISLHTATDGDARIVNKTAIDLAASIVGGHLSATATIGSITDSGTITVAKNARFETVVVDETITLDQLAVTGTIRLFTQGTNGDAMIVNTTQVDLANSDVGGNLNVTATTGGIVDSGTVTVAGDARFDSLESGADILLDQLDVTGTITVMTVGPCGDVTLVNTTAIDLAASVIDGALSVTATTGSITDSGTITVAKDARFETLTADDTISLDQLNVSGTIGLFTLGSNGNASIVNTTQVDLAASGVGGNLNVMATTGGIVDSGTATVAGMSDFTSQESGANVVLDQLNVSGSISVLTTGPSGDATLVNAVGIDFANSSVDGKLIATATTGSITDSGMTLVSGDAGFTSRQNGQSIGLDQLGVDGSISVHTATDGDATIVNKTAIDLAASIVGGNLSATATTGSITDSGTITVVKNARFETVVADETITLDRLNVTGTIGLFTQGGNGHATIGNATQVDLAASDVGGNLDATATTGGIVDSGTVTVAGDARFDSLESGAEILLDQLDVTGTITVMTVGPCGDVTLVNATAVDLAASVIDGALSVTATTGSITDSGTITVSKDARFKTLRADDSISLDQLNVSGTIGLFTQGGNGTATIVNTTQVDLAAGDVDGNLDVTATTGGIIDSGLVTVAGDARFDSLELGADIFLDQLDVTGAITVMTVGPCGDVTLVNTTAIDLAASVVEGAMSVAATTGSISDSGTITVAKSARFETLTVDDTIILDQLNVTGTIGLFTQGSNGNASIVNTTQVDLSVSDVGGNLNVTATTGGIADSGTVTAVGTSDFMSLESGADVVLDQLNVTGSISLMTTGPTGDATLVNAVGIDFANSTVDGKLIATATTGSITDSGMTLVSGDAGFTTLQNGQSIFLDQLGVDGTISAHTGTDGDATIVNKTAIDLAASIVGGHLSATSTTGSITDSGTIIVAKDARFETLTPDESIVLDQLNVAGAIGLFTQGSNGDATIVNSTQVDLATSDVGGNLSVTATTGGIVDTGTVTVAGDARFDSLESGADILLDQLDVAGAITVMTVGPCGDVTLVNTTGIDLAASTIDGALSVTVRTGSITDSGTITVAKNARFETLTPDETITLDQLNVTGTIGLFTQGNNGDAMIVNTTQVDLATSDVGGNLSVTATTSGIVDTGTVTVAGDVRFDSLESGADILLDQLDVAGTITVTTVGPCGDVTLVNTTGIDLAASVSEGALSVTATTGSIIDSGTITVAKDARFETLASNDTITLDQLNVTGTIGLFTQGTSGNATIVNTTQVDLAASDVGGDLFVTATTGGIVDSGVVTVSGAGNFTSLQSSADILLNQLNVSGSISLLTTGPTADATLVNAIGIDFANSTVVGNLTATATTGGMTDSGMTLVSGDANFATLQDGQSITLDQLGIDGSISLHTAADGDATIVNKTAIDLAASIVGGHLSATATTGSITDSGAITVAKNARFETVAADKTIALDDLNVTGNIGLFTQGINGDASIVNTTQVDLAASDVGGNLNVTATTGGIVDSGTVTVAGDARFDSLEPGADILLDQLDVTGTIAVMTVGPCGDVTLVNTTAIDLATSIIEGALSVTATTGSITDSGAITVAKDARFETLTADETIALDELNVTGPIGLFTQGSSGDATIVNTTQIDLATSDVGGDLVVTATTGGIVDSGLVTVAGTGDFRSLQTGADVLLDQLNVTGSISVLTTGPTADATLVNTIGIDFANSTVDGNLTATATTGGMTDSGMTLVSGDANFATLQDGQSITLDQLGIDGSISLHTAADGDATIVNKTAIDLAASIVGGHLSATATTGSITDSGAITVAKNARFETVAADKTIALDDLNVTGNIGLFTQGINGDASIVNTTQVDLAASDVGGNLNVTATTGGIVDSGTVTVAGDARFDSLEPGADILLDQLDVTGTIAVMTVGPCGDVTLVNTTAIDLATSVIEGALSVTATSGLITDSGAITVAKDARFETMSTNETVTLDQLNVTGTIGLFTQGGQGISGGATIVNTTQVDLAASDVGGNLNVTATTGGIIDSDAITVGGDARFVSLESGADILLDQLDVGDTITVMTAGPCGDVTLVNTTSIDLAASVVDGELSVIATTGSITDSGTVTVAKDARFETLAVDETITLDQLDVTGTIGLFTQGGQGISGDATIVNTTQADLATSRVGGNLTVTATTSGIVDSGTVTVGGTGNFSSLQSDADVVLDQLIVSGSISLSTTGPSGDVTMVNATDIDFANSTVDGRLIATATTGGVTDSGMTLVTGAASFTTLQTSQSIVLDQLGVDGSISLHTAADGDATIVNKTAIDLSGSIIGGDLSATATTGSFTDTGTITLAENARFETSISNETIALDQLDVTGAIVLFTQGVSGDATIVNTMQADLAASGVSGDLAVTATTGGIVDSGTVTVGGTARFDSLESGADIVLNQLDVTGSIAVMTVGPCGDVTLVNTTVIDLATGVVDGALSVTAATGSITDSGTVTVAKDARFETLSADETITLDQLNVTTTIGLFTQGNNGAASIVNTTRVDLAASTVGGDLAVTATIGDIADGGTVTVSGTGNFMSLQSGADILLDQLDVTGSVSLLTTGPSGDATLVNTIGIDFADSTVGGNLTATATTGRMTDSGMTLVSGDASFTTLQNSQSIQLDQLGIDGSITVHTAIDGDATIVNKTAIDLGASIIGGDLSATATTGPITDSGTITVAETTRFETRAADQTITLDQLDVTGTIGLFTQGNNGDATIVNTTGVKLSTSDVRGDMRVTATTGGVSDSGIVSVLDKFTVESLEPGADILLDTLDVARLNASTIGPAADADVTNMRSLAVCDASIAGVFELLVDGDLTFVGDVTATNVTARATGQLDVLASATISSAPGQGGSLVLHNVAIEGQVVVGMGDVTLTSDTGNRTLIAAPLTNAGTILLTADQDLFVEASVVATGTGNWVDILAAQGDGLNGGVRISEAGAIDAVDRVHVSGGLFVGPPADDVGIHVGVGTHIRSSASSVILDTMPLATLVSGDVEIDGAVDGLRVDVTTGRDLLSGGQVVVHAHGDGVTLDIGRDIVMVDGGRIQADDSSILVESGRHISIAQFLAAGSGAAIDITAVGSVSDAGDAAVDLVVVVGPLRIDAATVGQGNALETNVSTVTATIGAGGISFVELDDLAILDLGSVGDIQISAGGGLSVNQLTTNSNTKLTVADDVLMANAASKIGVLNGLLEIDAGKNVGDGDFDAGLPLMIEADRLSLGAGGDVNLNSPVLNDADRLIAGGVIHWRTTSSTISGAVQSEGGFIELIGDDLNISPTGRIQSDAVGRFHILPTGDFLVGSSVDASVFDLTDAEWDRVDSDIVQVIAPATITVEEAWTLAGTRVGSLHLQTPSFVDLSNGSLSVDNVAIESSGLTAPGPNQIGSIGFDISEQFELNNDVNLVVDDVDGVTSARYIGGPTQILTVDGSLHLAIGVETSSTGFSQWNVTGPLTQASPLTVDRLSIDSGDRVTLDLANDFDQLSINAAGDVRITDVDELRLADHRVGDDLVAPNVTMAVGGNLLVDGQVVVANEWNILVSGSVTGGIDHFVAATTLTSDVAGSIGSDAAPIVSSIRRLSADTSGLFLNNAGTLTVESALGAALTSDTDARIVNSGDLTVNGTVNVIGDLTLTTDMGADLTLAQDVHVENGNLAATAGRDIHLVDSGTSGFDATIVGPNSIAVFRAAEQILFGEGYVVSTDDGRYRHFPLVENVTFFVEPLSKGGSNINGAGEATIQVIAGIDGELNYEFEINWFDGTVEINPPADDASIQFDGNSPYQFSHEYDANPDEDNASAPVPVSVTIRWNPRASGQHGVQFYANGESATQATTIVNRTQTVSGEGIQSFVFTFESEIEAAPERRQSATTTLDQVVTTGVKVQETLVGTRRDAEATSIARRRVYIQEVDELTGELTGKAVEISGDLPNFAEKIEDFDLTNGRYRVFVQEANSSRSRTIVDVNVANGKVVPRGYRSNSADQQPDSTGNVVDEAKDGSSDSNPGADSGADSGAALDTLDRLDAVSLLDSVESESNGRVLSTTLGPVGLLIASRTRRQARSQQK